MSKVQVMLERSQLGPGEILYDLGAGDGRMVITAARKGAFCYAVEVDPLKSWLIAWRVRRRRLSDQIWVARENFFQIDLRMADVVTVYLSPAAVKKLAVKFETELKTGSRVVSYRRAIPEWTPESDADEIYVYRMPQNQYRQGETLQWTK